MRSAWLGGLLAGVLIAASAAATPVSLDTLLATVDTDPSVHAAQAEHKASLDDVSVRKTESGPQLYMNAGAGHYRELNSANLIDDYYGRNMAVGLRFPLLGTLRRQLDALGSARFEAQRKQLQIALRHAERQLTLKTTYADWWRAQQENAVCDRLRPHAETALRQVQQQRQVNWLRTSDALSESMKWNDLQGRCDTAASAENELEAALAVLAGQAFPAHAHAVPVALHVDPAPLVAWQAQINQHPNLRSRQITIDENQQLKDRSWYNSIESSLSLGYALESRSGVSRQGNSFIAALNFSMPFEIGGHVTSTGNAAAARYQAARYQWEAERRQLMIDIGAALRAQRQAYQTLAQRQEQVTVARVRLFEQIARSDVENENGVILRQAAERDYYQAQLDQIASWHSLWLRNAALQLFTDEHTQTALLGHSTITWAPDTGPRKSSRAGVRQAPDRRTAPAHTAATPKTVGAGAAVAEPGKQPPWTIGAYVWNSHFLLDEPQHALGLDALRTAGMQRIYLGLDARQLVAIADTKRALRRVIEAAGYRGITVSLLLGDPAWMTPEHREDLILLIRTLADVPFSSLHLDLEVEQLGWPVPDSRLTFWLDTLRAVQKASPWPIELSSHHRWFDAPKESGPCVPCELPKLGISSVSLMVYTRNSARSTALMQAAAQRWPAIAFRLAQSIEAGLPPDESWATADTSQIQDSMTKWCTVLGSQGIRGVDWQDWADYHRHSSRQP